ncbi:MAG: type I methionyl aminopeptidase [Propionibacteriaceae bacterium]|jgi:methionyl aminopeptidase|nr:type I methionyl aminopeptidase [Propionibacteriaceae bacterium]
MGRIQLKTQEQILQMRAAGLVVCRGLEAMSAAAVAGATTADIDAVGREVLLRANAQSNFLGYGGEYGVTPYPGVACVSPNEMVVHGIPGSRVLVAGDVVSIDFGAIVAGWHGDAARSVAVAAVSSPGSAVSVSGEPSGGTDVNGVSAKVIGLIATTCEASWVGITALWRAAQLSDVSHAIQRYVERQPHRYGIVREYTGHGIGTEMHMDPDVPNYARPGRGPRITPGMVLCIEPMLTLGHPAVTELEDDWSVVTRDGSWAAHWENTVAVLADGLWVLTEPDGGAAELAARGVPLASLAVGR